MVGKFVVRSVLLLVLMGVVWERSPVSDYYHRALAACTRVVWPDRNIQFVGGDFVTRVRLANENQVLHLKARDLTMNICVLAAVYLASLRRRRLFTFCCGTAFVVLFAIHAAALEVTIRATLAWQAGHGIYSDVIGQLGPWMYPVAMLLWAPYIAMRFWSSHGHYRAR